MREPFPAQPTLDTLPIVAVPLNTQCRHEIIPILAALQQLYADQPARDRLLDLIGQDINATTSPCRGRPGLDYWQILVLAGVRLGCDLDYDALQNLAEEHNTLRRIMGIGFWDDDEPDAKNKKLDWRRINENLLKIGPETLEQLNMVVVKVGHKLEPQAPEHVRGDSFVVETNIHYPTDAGVLADGLRKVIQLAAVIAGILGFTGWRQGRHLQKRLKELVRAINQACKSKKAGATERRRGAYQPLLKLGRKVLGKARVLLETVQARPELFFEADMAGRVAELQRYVELSERVAENARRRVVAGETVPNGDKIFSVFEPHTELINRGKAPVAWELGRRVLLIEDSVGFILQYKRLERGSQDKDVGVRELQEAQNKVGGKIKTASFDRGFHSPENQEGFAGVVSNPCVPVRGYKQAARQEAEASEEFWRSRRRHPGVESLINSVQAGNGLERCRDRTEKGLDRYIGLGVLGRNLHVLGRLVLERMAPGCEAAKTRRKKIA